MRHDQIKKIVLKGGGPVRLAKELGISSQAISQWRRVPLSRIQDVSRITKTPISTLLKLAATKPTQRSAS